MTDLEQRLRSILLADQWFVGVLQAVRDRDLPDWVVGAGVIRNLGWDHLHGLRISTPARDVDVAYYDPTDVTREGDPAIELDLANRLPSVVWDVTNQAGVHLWYPQKFGHPIAPIDAI